MPKYRWEEGNGVVIGAFYLTMAHLDSGEKTELTKSKHTDCYLSTCGIDFCPRMK